jgi:hypothetical protein
MLRVQHTCWMNSLSVISILSWKAPEDNHVLLIRNKKLFSTKLIIKYNGKFFNRKESPKGKLVMQIGKTFNDLKSRANESCIKIPLKGLQVIMRFSPLQLKTHRESTCMWSNSLTLIIILDFNIPESSRGIWT